MGVVRLANEKVKYERVTSRMDRIQWLLARRNSHLKWINELMRSEITPTPVEYLFVTEAEDYEDGTLEFMLRELPLRSIYALPPSQALYILSKLSEHARVGVRESVRLVFFGGEPSSERRKKELAEQFPHAEIVETYSMSEFDYLTTDCASLRSRYREQPYCVCHPFFTDYSFHIKDPGADGFGEIAITSFELTNYLTGDVGKLVEEPCECGMRTTLIVAGRIDYDRLHLLGTTFLSVLIAKVMETFSTFITDYLFEIGESRDERGRSVGTIDVYVVPSAPLLPASFKEMLAAAISAKLYVTKTRTLASFIEEGLFEHPKIHLTEIIARPSAKVTRLRRKNSAS